MRKLILVAIFVCSGAANSDVWETVAEDGSKIECPSFLFIDGGSYEVLNDCYGMEPKHPVVESGRIEQSESSVSFIDRAVDQPVFIGDGDDDVEFSVVERGGDYIVLGLDSRLYRFQIQEWSE